MKKSRKRLICSLICLALALPLISGCVSPGAKKDPAPGSGSSIGSSMPGDELTPEQRERLDQYERTKKAESHRNMGNAYLSSGKHSAALAEYRAALKLTPDDYNLLYETGLVYLVGNNNPNEAINYFTRVLELKPAYGPAINSMGNAYLMLEKYDEAIKYYDQIDENIIYATPYMPMTNKGLAYYKKGDLVQAERCYKRALQMEPNYVNAMVLLSELQMETGRNKEALQSLQRASRLNSSAAIKYYLGLAYMKNDNAKEAGKIFEEIMQNAPLDSELYIKSAEALRKLNAPY